MKKNRKNFLRQGFTLLELFLGMGFIAVLAAVSLPLSQSFQNTNDLDIAVTAMTQSLRRAQVLSQSVASDTTWGVLATTSAIVLFQGGSYATRDASFDEMFDTSPSLSVSGVQELVFNKVFGEPVASGTTTFTSTQAGARTVDVNVKGLVTY